MRTPDGDDVTEIELRIRVVDNRDGTCTQQMTYTVDGVTVMDETGVSPVMLTEQMLELGNTMKPTLLGAIDDGTEGIDLSQIVTIPNAPDDVPPPP